MTMTIVWYYNVLWETLSLSAFDFALYTDVKYCIQSTGDLGGIRTHDLSLISANVLTSRPPSLPGPNFMALFTMEFCAYILPRPIEIRVLLGAVSTEFCGKQRHEIGAW